MQDGMYRATGFHGAAKILGPDGEIIKPNSIVLQVHEGKVSIVTFIGNAERQEPGKVVRHSATFSNLEFESC